MQHKTSVVDDGTDKKQPFSDNPMGIKDFQMRLIKCFSVFFACLLLFFFSGSLALAAGEENPGAPSAYIAKSHYEFEPALEGSEVIYGFVLQNKGTANLIVEKVKTD